jgi:hypothetical protein
MSENFGQPKMPSKERRKSVHNIIRQRRVVERIVTEFDKGAIAGSEFAGFGGSESIFSPLKRRDSGRYSLDGNKNSSFSRDRSLSHQDSTSPNDLSRRPFFTQYAQSLENGDPSYAYSSKNIEDIECADYMGPPKVPQPLTGLDD